MRVLTGVQPSGTPHIGNYIGAMRPILDMAKEHETFIFIADLHALTTMHDKKALKEATQNLILDYLALGLDPEKTVFYKQSAIHGHTELAWILSTLAPMGLLERCTAYKDKVAKGLSANVGLFTYPVLMSADIILYDADIVPVGKDQKQHVEVARDLAGKFNHAFGETFVLPEAKISEETGIIMGTDGQKMSKSYGNTIEIFADEKVIRKKVMSIQTDSAGVADKKEYKGNAIYELSCLFMNKEELEILQKKFTQGGVGYGDMKKDLAEKIIDYFAPYKAKRDKIDPKDVEEILKKGAERAQRMASNKLKKVYKRVGLV